MPKPQAYRPGDRRGMLTVVDRAGRRNQQIVYRARCDCGSEVLRSSYQLTRSKRTWTCGCDNSYCPGRPANIAGERFGRLVAIKHVGKTQNNHAKWLFACNCGSTTVATANAVKSGGTVSCGCQQKEKARANCIARHTTHGLSYTREYVRYTTQRRRARKLEAGGSHTLAEWRAVVARQRGRCAGCGEIKDLTEDHIVPLAAGGSDDISNIQGLCQPCNSSKWTRDAVTWQREKFGRLI